MRDLDLEDLRAVAASALPTPMEVRDGGLLESALARPCTTVLGEDACPTVWDKAAALLHSLVDGNERVGFTAAVLLLRRNDLRLSFGEDEAYDLVIAVAEGRLEVPEIAAVLAVWGVGRSHPTSCVAGHPAGPRLRKITLQARGPADRPS